MERPSKPRRTPWQRCRRGFRWTRITCLSLVLGVLLLLTWLRWVGVPDWVRLRVVHELAQRGIAANFKSLRFDWFRGLVAQDLRVAWGGATGPRITIDEADLDLSPPPWPETRRLVRGLSIRRGTVRLPVLATNEPPGELRIDDLNAEVRFPAGDLWEVPRLSGHTLGIQVETHLALTNTAALRRRRTANAPKPDLAERMLFLRRLLREVEGWTLEGTPRLAVNLQADGDNPAASTGDLYLDIPGARLPQGTVRQLRLSLRTVPNTPTNEPSRLAGVLEIGDVQTGDGGLSGLSSRVELTVPPGDSLPTQAQWMAKLDHLFVRGLRLRDAELAVTNVWLNADAGDGTAPQRLASARVKTTIQTRAQRIEAAQVQGEPIVGQDVTATLDLAHGLERALPEALRFQVRVGELHGRPGDSGAVTLAGEYHRRATAEAAPAELGPWRFAWPYEGTNSLHLEQVKSPKLEVAAIHLDTRWNPPLLSLPRVEAQLYGGNLAATGSLQVLTREARLTARTTFDLHGIDALLGPRSRSNFVRYQWSSPPNFTGQGQAVLPAWTNRHPDWDGEVKPTVRLGGRFDVGAGSFKGVPFDRAESSIAYDGTYWTLPDLHTERPEGRQEIRVVYNEDTREYQVDAEGAVFPPVLKPVLGEQSAEVLDFFTFPEPVRAKLSIWGPWTEGTGQGIRGHVETRGFVFREQRFDRLVADVNYTNRFLAAAPVRLERDGRELLAEGVGYDFAGDLLTLTNVVSTLDHQVVAAAISPTFPEKLAPYRFNSPPKVRVDGSIRPRATESAALDFAITGGPFAFWRLSASEIESRLLWRGPSLYLTNIHAGFYGGTLEGHANFDLRDPAHGRYTFDARVRNASLGELLLEATRGKTNLAQGTFDLNLAVTSAETADVHSWDGDGWAELRDGQLWNTPIFGFLSPILNTLVPGLGNSRAKAANATFTITNGVIYTRDMTISSPPATLNYRGSIDFDQRVNAKVEAQVLNEMTGMGPLFGLVLRPLTKLFEFRVTGTLTDVHAAPLYVPRFLFLPLQPLKFLKDLLGGGNEKKNNPSTTPAPEELPVPPAAPAPASPSTTTPNLNPTPPPPPP